MKQRIAEVRRSKGLSQGELAKRIGATLSMIGKLERGERTINFAWLQRIADAMDVGLVELIELDGDVVRVGSMAGNGHVDLYKNDDGSRTQINELIDAARRNETAVEREILVVEDTSINIPSGACIRYAAAEGETWVAPEMLNRLCMIFPAEAGWDGFIGFILNGSLPDRFHVFPVGGKPMEDVKIMFAALVTEIRLP